MSDKHSNIDDIFRNGLENEDFSKQKPLPTWSDTELKLIEASAKERKGRIALLLSSALLFLSSLTLVATYQYFTKSEALSEISGYFPSHHYLIRIPEIFKSSSNYDDSTKIIKEENNQNRVEPTKVKIEKRSKLGLSKNLVESPISSPLSNENWVDNDVDLNTDLTKQNFTPSEEEINFEHLESNPIVFNNSNVDLGSKNIDEDLTLDIEKSEEEQSKVPSKPKKFKNKKEFWSMGFTIEGGINDFNTRVNDESGLVHPEYSKFSKQGYLSAPSFGFEIYAEKVKKKQRWQIGLGFKDIRAISDFNINFSKFDTVYLYDPNGKLIGYDKENERDTQVVFSDQLNRFQLEIPVKVGLNIYSHKTFSIAAKGGLTAIFFLAGNGTYLDPRTLESRAFRKADWKNMIFNAYLGLSFEKRLSDNWKITAEPFYTRSLMDLYGRNFAVYSWNANYGLKLGMSWDF